MNCELVDSTATVVQLSMFARINVEFIRWRLINKVNQIFIISCVYALCNSALFAGVSKYSIKYS